MKDKKITTSKDFIGKEVRLYPHDTYKKNAILLSIDQNGYVFEITSCEDKSQYKVGEIVFINHSFKVTFILK